MFRAYTEFQKLKRVMIGKGLSTDIVDHEFFYDKLTPTTKRLLIQLLDETEEDYQSLVKICEDFGCEVLRPSYSLKGLDPYLMNPRDDAIVLDNYLVSTQTAVKAAVDLLEPVSSEKNNIVRNKNTYGLMPPSIVRLGKDIIFDKPKWLKSNTRESVDYIKNILQPLDYNVIYTETHEFPFKAAVSHADACFSIQKPGVLMTSRDARHYTDNIFKGWNAHQVEHNSFKRMSDWITFKKDTKSFMFTNNKYLDAGWNQLLTTWLSNWAGFAKETLFDVNVLSLDENHVIVSNYNKDTFDFFKKHNIEPIITPWRHRFFWDGGIHCITLDLEREGGCEQYL